jgi:hypothetical protein
MSAAADTTNEIFKIKKSEAITVEPKEGIEEGGHTARWVIAEVVCVAGCSRSRPYPSPWSHRRHRIGGAIAVAGCSRSYDIC